MERALKIDRSIASKMLLFSVHSWNTWNSFLRTDRRVLLTHEHSDFLRLVGLKGVRWVFTLNTFDSITHNISQGNIRQQCKFIIFATVIFLVSANYGKYSWLNHNIII